MRTFKRYISGFCLTLLLLFFGNCASHKTPTTNIPLPPPTDPAPSQPIEKTAPPEIPPPEPQKKMEIIENEPLPPEVSPAEQIEEEKRDPVEIMEEAMTDAKTKEAK